MLTLHRGYWLSVVVWTALESCCMAAEATAALSPVELGERLFYHNFGRPGAWSGPESLGSGGDGLGPMYNDVSCVACHRQAGAGGGGPNEKNALILSFSPRSGLNRTQLEGVVRDANRLHQGLTANRTSLPLHRRLCAGAVPAESIAVPAQPGDAGRPGGALWNLWRPGPTGWHPRVAQAPRLPLRPGVYATARRSTCRR